MRKGEDIGIIGAGAVGAAYAAMFSHMDPPPGRLFFIAAGERGGRLQREGVVVNGKRYLVPTVPPAEAEPVDLLIVAVKYYDLEKAITDMAGAVGPETTIMSLMNGIDSEERIGAVYGMDRVVYALNLGIDAVRTGNCVRYTNPGVVYFGEATNPVMTERVRRLHELFARARIPHTVPADMIRTLWFKFMVNVGVNQVSAVLGANYGLMRTSPAARSLMEAAMGEVIAVAKAVGVDLSEEDIAAWYKVLERLDAEGKTSMLQDIEAGRRTEVEMFAGKVIALGNRHGVPTPVNIRLSNEIRKRGA
ncbi:MAG TPA: 2-dehydropantoate 2-reductase [Syntrophales bacterium]|jgi:2-dehydropantoate 2-reductase|nr:2-dehydropantoate 2-reductase [Syntrophales bacterium]